MGRAGLLAAFVAVASVAGPAAAAGLDGVRGSTPFTASAAPLQAPPILSGDVRQPRGSLGQPPVIPHTIAGYRLELRANDCLSCHGRVRTEQSPGPAMSISHFTGRDGQLSQTVAADRYFCTECHVSQAVVSPPVKNTFKVMTTAPSHRHSCMECHMPQILTSAPSGAAKPAVAAPDHTAR
ncbi:MAG: nitrate reductase cytochrome c-type subunit [Alphaproteobacteria bacterium]|nr:nitrate reductase cytochrome c-type subunit [Alphaproteobacteria bacterium]